VHSPTAGAPPSSCLSPGLTPLERYVVLGLASCPIDNVAKISLFQILGEPLPQIEKHRVLRPRRLRRLTLVTMADADQSNRPHRKTKEKKAAHSGAPNPKAFAFATPGRLQKQAARSHDVCYSQPFDWAMKLTMIPGQRKALPRPPCRSPPRRSASHHCRRCWPSRRRQDDTDKILNSPLHEANPLRAGRASHSRHIQKTTPHVHRMSSRLVGGHDRCRESS
jgi:hypothetical protein